MKTKTRLDSCILVHSIKNKDLKFMKNAVKVAEKKNLEIFKKKIKPFKLVLCDDLADYKKEIGLDSPTHTATVKFGKIIMITPSSKDSLPKDFVKFIVYHEMNHKYYMSIVGHNKPVWFMEGIAMLIQSKYSPESGWKRYLAQIHDTGNYLLVNSTKLKTIEERNKFYILSYFCIKYLEKTRGRGSLIDFLKKIPSPYNDKSFWIAFRKTFNLNKKELVHKSLR